MREAYNRQYNSNFSCVMPTNLFGPNDKYGRISCNSCVDKEFINLKLVAKIIKVWGDGTPKNLCMLMIVLK